MTPEEILKELGFIHLTDGLYQHSKTMDMISFANLDTNACIFDRILTHGANLKAKKIRIELNLD